MDAVKNPAKSNEAGIPVFDTVPFCEIRILGEPDTVVGPVAEVGADKRFPEAWAHWQRDHSTEGVVGTLIDRVPWLERGDVETLKHLGIKTLENLANVADGSIGNVPGGLALRQKARDALANAKADAPLQRMSDELAKRDEEIKALKTQIQEILASRRGKGKE